MATSLIKGQSFALESSLRRVVMGLGWNPRLGYGEDFDLDAVVFMLGEDGRVRSDADVIFYNQLKSSCGSVVHLGDDLTGKGTGDAEQIVVDLPNVPSDVARIVFAVAIFEARERRQNFGILDAAYIRVCDAVQGAEIVRFDLAEDACVSLSFIFGELYRCDGAWNFRTTAEGYDHEIDELARLFGVKRLLKKKRFCEE